MTHLTLTGYQAGWPLCDCDKEQARQRGDTFQHAAYVTALSRIADLCPECFRVWTQPDDEGPDNAA